MCNWQVLQLIMLMLTRLSDVMYLQVLVHTTCVCACVLPVVYIVYLL